MKTLVNLKSEKQIQILSSLDSHRLKGGGRVKGIDNLEGDVD